MALWYITYPGRDVRGELCGAVRNFSSRGLVRVSKTPTDGPRALADGVWPAAVIAGRLSSKAKAQ
ncbi:hypothetical protein CH291_02605 [Rhodococcus sp. 14-1411-2a]|nr:hypothetical protein CH291_02605 [Rhodococcus sp. 14-1411-2a]